MKDQLSKIYNTLMQIETKGQSTLLMAAALLDVQKLIQEGEQKNDNENNEG